MKIPCQEIALMLKFLVGCESVGLKLASDGGEDLLCFPIEIQ